MEITIEIFEEKNQNSFGAEIYLNKKWFKEIGGLLTPEYVLKAIAYNKDFLQTINNYKLKKQKS